MERIKIHASRNTVIATLLAGGGLSAGGGIGYIWARHRLSSQFNSRLDAEILAIKDHYNRALDELEKRVTVPDDVAASDGSVHWGDDDHMASDSGDEVDGPAAVGTFEEPAAIYSGVTVPDDLLENSAFIDRVHIAEHEEGAVDAEAGVSISGVERDPDRPYVVSLEEFCEPPAGRDQLTITYYAGDKVLVDDKDDPIPNIVNTIGPVTPLSFGGISKDPHLMYVRNDQLDIDFEVVLNTGSYADIVLNYGRTGERNVESPDS